MAASELEKLLLMKQRYDQIISQDSKGYSLVTITLKNFMEYRHLVGHDKSVQIIRDCDRLLASCLDEGEWIYRLHSWYFMLLIKCAPELPPLHERAHAFHHAIKDTMMEAYGRPLYLEMGFCPIIEPYLNFYTAQYYADLCHTGEQQHYPETNYDMYYISYVNQKETFKHLEEKVTAALRDGEFKLFLQPKVDLRTDQVSGAEALMRWITKDGEMIPLSSFLPNLEENGFIREVDLYLFDLGCRYIEKWKKETGKQIQISFNLSKAYFDGPYFAPEYGEVFHQYDIPGKLICIELLESIVLNDLDRLKEIVQCIYDFGFDCALDDFGSGFSSFDILTNIPLSQLKIDKSLFQNIQNFKERYLIKHLIEIAHEFGIVTVAEGVETEEYVRYLTENNCDYIQGFYFYKPMPVEEFERLFVLDERK